MLCRILLTAVVVSYLICVLWLSGLQKEDFDVHVLSKLQRHNVNIDDMNNETLKQECAYRSNLTSKSKVITTTKSINADDNYKASQIYSDNNSSYFETIAKYLTDKTTPFYNNQPEVHHETKIYSQRGYANVSDTNYKLEQEAKIGPENTESSRPDLQKILQFWQKLQKPIVNYNQDIKKESVLRTDIENLPEPQILTKTTNQATLPKENINQLLSEYISRNLITMSTTKAPDRKLNGFEFNLQSLYNKFIANKNNMKPMQENQFTTSVTSNTYNDNTFKQPRTIRPNNMGENVTPLQKSINEMNLLLLNNQFKSFASWHSYQNDITQMPNRNTNNARTSETDILNGKELINSLPKLFNKQSENSPVMNTQTKDKEQIPGISNNVIREITEHIKDLVLQDFRKNNIWNTTSSSTTTTMMTSLARTNSEPSTESPRKSKLENKSDETHHVFERFLELFEQIKATKERTIITADTKYSMTNMNHEYLNIINKTSKKLPSVNVVNLPYRVEQNPVINLPMFRNSTPHEKRVHPPSIIQTNSDEIAPLIIPISKPMKIINQVLLVTSANTKHQRWAQPVTPKMTAYFNNRHPNGKERPEYISHISNRDREDTILYDDNYSYRTHVRQRPEYHSNNKYTHDRSQEYQINNHDPFGSNLQNYNEMHNRESLHIDTNRPPPRHNRVRFHEKLERLDGRQVNFDNNRYHDGREHRLRVASRQQKPVNSIQNNFKYNDIHFRKFLKTQQKVNDMLERILATKTKTDGPFNSFEIA